MADEKRYSKREIAVGLLLSACAAGLAVATLQYVRAGTFWKKRQETFVVFDNVGSLTQDAPVRYNGIEKGRVKSLRPVHLDAAFLEDKFPVLLPHDLDNLPIRSDAKKRELLELPAAQFDKACREQLVGATMIELCLELLDENDPIRYHRNDEVRIVSTIFGDSAVEIVAGGHAPGSEPARPHNYIVGDSGDFESNLLKSMGEMKKILGNVREVVGADERHSFGSAQSRYEPVTKAVNTMTQIGTDRMARTIKRFGELSTNANERLNKTGKVLESLVPAAEKATKSVQAALKEIESKTIDAKKDAQSAMGEISKDAAATRDAIKEPLETLTEGLSSTQSGLFKAKTDFEKAPARLDAALDAAGSMQSQSTSDMLRVAEAGKKIIPNLKIAAYVAKENKDLMLANRDSGEYLAQSALDIRRKLAMVSRRMTNAGADAVETIQVLKSDPAIEPVIDPVVERVEEAVKRLQAVRNPLDALLQRMEETMYPAWNRRKRAAWFGDGLVRF